LLHARDGPPGPENAEIDMTTKMMVAAGVCAAALIAGAGFAMSGGGKADKIADTSAVEASMLAADAETPKLVEPEIVAEAEPAAPVKVAAAPQADCRKVASNETGFDPATTTYPVREDAGNKQVLKGAAVGAAVGAIGGEVITDRAGIGAAVGAGAGALGGHAMKKSKQNAANERYDAEVAAYQQSKSAYDAALQTCLAA
jgi:uncharacterized protein YcfJ